MTMGETIETEAEAIVRVPEATNGQAVESGLL
jgi:hypothetical protein